MQILSEHILLLMTMTSSSSCGIALKSEGISYCASARIPIVYCNVQRGGPGVGAIQPAQMDYMQATRASGNGGFKMMVFAHQQFRKQLILHTKHLIMQTEIETQFLS